ncbi:signal peptidase I [Metasolibacillus meyeri]|uniref:signal peptidase I n=1 Tax=Metasolibacillus meyeri TaxID=1071052 RepID=UPI000D31A430|nr:signal peptidase I [Metasolibacillus meyeri]
MKKNYVVISLLVAIIVIVVFITFQKEKVLADTTTPEKLPTVEQTVDTYLVEWLFDTMDRGNHDFESHEHGKLVISENIPTLQRGMVVYYEIASQFTQENANLANPTLGRVVGLPGETLEIKKGKVYIDGQRLDAFYGEATQFGMNKEQYFQEVAPEKRMNHAEKYFNESMPAITVEDNTVFVLVDCWWRGHDSRYFGLIPMEAMQGIVLGYEE